MKESKIQSECVRWFKNDHLDALTDEGLITVEMASRFRKLFHSNMNELPVFKGVKMPKDIRDLLNGWIRTAKSMGLTAGVADMSFKQPVMIEGVMYFFLEIEFKTTTGRQSPHQLAYQSAVEASGGYYKIIRSIEEFKQFINSISNVNIKTLPSGINI